MEKNNILIIDGNNYAHRAFHKFTNLNNRHDQVTSVIYGMPLILANVIKKFKPSKIYVAFDGGKDKHRLDILPTYKQKKPKLGFDYENFIWQLEEVRGILNTLGIRILHCKKREADDLIYQMAKRLSSKNKRAIICSSDKDFHQLVSDNIHIWNHSKEVLVTPKNCKGRFSYQPDQCVDYLCLDGDASDKIPGYRGMGEKRIAKFFAEFYSIQEYLDSDKTLDHLDKKILQFTYDRNRQLIDLDLFHTRFYNGSRMPYWKKDIKPHFNVGKLQMFCDRHNIKTFLNADFLNTFKNLK